jgi:starch synthase (maltosyl-transferring)
VRGESVPITATLWREGHDAIAGTVVWRGPNDATPRRSRMLEMVPGTDKFSTLIAPDEEGLHTFRIEAWSDPWETWMHSVNAKIGAGQKVAELANDLELGARLIDRVARRPERRADRPLLNEAVRLLRDVGHTLPERVAAALSDPVRAIMFTYPVRELVTKGKTFQLYVDRKRALFGSWYELFPRSTGSYDEHGHLQHGTFETATPQLDRIHRMGFDVVYLPPIHPIGRVNRKGANNSVIAQPGEVGSPWAIGAAEGGHDAVHPDLGTIEDFDKFVARAHELNLEVALDLALQCAPDHPWVGTHPEWFTKRPDGTIAYAENPPKRYQDIYPLNFDNDPEGIYAEILRVVLHWVNHGVNIFRVDNPHTKPANFWHWLIWQVKQRHPEVLFLAEAFTRPARLYGLGNVGFTQSYTYFTWRTAKEELVDFGVEIVEHAHQSRPNLFVNTPDILHDSLHSGDPAVFALRAALAATMSPTWGIYSGYELYESDPVKPGSEEYLDSEKYQLRHRDYQGAVDRGQSLEPYLRQLNEIRRRHPALQQLRELKFHHTTHDDVVAFSKQDPATKDTVICIINLNPFQAAEGDVWLNMPDLDLDWDARFTAYDEVSGETWEWGQTNYVKLEPWHHVAHIIHVRGA